MDKCTELLMLIQTSSPQYLAQKFEYHIGLNYRNAEIIRKLVEENDKLQVQLDDAQDFAKRREL